MGLRPINSNDVKSSSHIHLDYWGRFRFNLVGLTGALVKEGLLVLLVFHYACASIISIETSISRTSPLT